MRLGIYGGSFDPVHLGHLAAAEEAGYRLGLDTVLFVPANRQPLKAGHPLAGAAERVEMLRMATAGNPRFAVSTIEIERPAPSFTVDTLRHLRALHGSACDLYLLLGVDAVNELHRWREPAELLSLAFIVVLSRGALFEPEWDVLEGIDAAARQRVITLAVPGLDISSSELRRRVAHGEPIRYQVAESTERLIRERGLYVR